MDRTELINQTLKQLEAAYWGNDFHPDTPDVQARAVLEAFAATLLESRIDAVTNAVDEWVRAGSGTYDELQAVVEQTLKPPDGGTHAEP